MKTKNAIISSGGWVSCQQHGRPGARKACRIAFYLLAGVVFAVAWLCRFGEPPCQEYPIVLLSGDILAWLIIVIDTVLWIRAAILGLIERPVDFTVMVRSPHVDPRKLY